MHTWSDSQILFHDFSILLIIKEEKENYISLIALELVCLHSELTGIQGPTQ